MNKSDSTAPAYTLEPLIINDLHGRVLHMPATRKKYAKRQILLIYGIHSSLERMFGIVQNIADFGTITMPDLPGMGGMDSFYKIGQTASIDNMADYLATFIKLHYKKQRFSVIAMSYGFVVVTRMLQKYPHLAKQVDICVSLAGLTDKNEFIVPKITYVVWRVLSRFFDGRLQTWFFRYVLLQPFIIKTTYRLQAKSHPKMVGADNSELKRRVNFEVQLWHMNDARTYAHATGSLFKLQTPHDRIKVPMLHISIGNDQYIDHKLTVKNLKKIYTGVTTAQAHMPNHAPTVVSTKAEAANFIPKKARQVLSRLPKS